MWCSGVNYSSINIIRCTKLRITIIRPCYYMVHIRQYQRRVCNILLILGTNIFLIIPGLDSVLVFGSNILSLILRTNLLGIDIVFSLGKENILLVLGTSRINFVLYQYKLVILKLKLKRRGRSDTHGFFLKVNVFEGYGKLFNVLVGSCQRQMNAPRVQLPVILVRVVVVICSSARFLQLTEVCVSIT